MPCTAHMPVRRSQIGRPTEVGGPSGSPVTCMIPPMPCDQVEAARPSREQSKLPRSSRRFQPAVARSCGRRFAQFSREIELPYVGSIPTQSLLGSGLDGSSCPIPDLGQLDL